MQNLYENYKILMRKMKDPSKTERYTMFTYWKIQYR